MARRSFILSVVILTPQLVTLGFQIENYRLARANLVLARQLVIRMCNWQNTEPPGGS